MQQCANPRLHTEFMSYLYTNEHFESQMRLSFFFVLRFFFFRTLAIINFHVSCLLAIWRLRGFTKMTSCTWPAINWFYRVSPCASPLRHQHGMTTAASSTAVECGCGGGCCCCRINAEGDVDASSCWSDDSGTAVNACIEHQQSYTVTPL